MSEVRLSNVSLHFYKIYHLDGKGQIKSSSLVKAFDDADALRQAELLATHANIEVWDRTRFVGIAGLLVHAHYAAASQAGDHGMTLSS